jgi:hypothetical protein
MSPTISRFLILLIVASFVGAPSVGDAQSRFQRRGNPAFLLEPDGERLEVATYNLTPRGPLGEDIEQTRALGSSIVEVVKTLLYAQTGESAANARGRKLWYDRNTLQLTVTDYPSNLRVVSDYIRSVMSAGAKKRSEIIHLKHQEAGQLQDTLNRVMGLETAAARTGGGDSITKTLRVEGELTFRDLRIRVTRINDNDVADKNDDSVEMVIRTPTTSEDRTIEEFRSEFIDDYELNVIEVKPSGTPGEGSAKLEVRFNPRNTTTVGPTNVR